MSFLRDSFIDRERDRIMKQSIGCIRQIAVLLTVAIIFNAIEAKPPSRVVNGEDGEIGEFPYTASVRHARNRHACGATIIGKRHLLTAAHCVLADVNDPFKDIAVFTGTNSIAPGAGTAHKIKTVVAHPDYSSKAEDSWNNDVAIIAVTDDIAFDFFTKPALLPISEVPENSVCVASGWGIMSHPGGIDPNNVRKIQMTIVNNENCQLAHNRTIHDTQLCAFEGAGTGLCFGDSGGPLVHDGTVVGVASWVRPCGQGYPDVFIRVYAYLDFIQKVIAST